MGQPKPALMLIGAGARTPLGLNAPTTAASVRAQISAMRDHTFVVDALGEPVIVCADAEIPLELPAVDRFLGLAVAAAVEAIAPLLGATMKVPSISVMVSLPEPRPGLPDDLEDALLKVLETQLVSQGLSIESVRIEALGHAGSLYFMEQALAAENRRGKGTLYLIGGVDSYLPVETLEWLDATEQMHSETTTWGYCPGEGAAFCLLSNADVAASLSLETSLVLISAASAIEHSLIGTDSVCTGKGLTDAFKKTLHALPDGYLVDGILCDMNGVPYRADEFGFAMVRTGQYFGGAADSATPADCWGDQGAASGCLFVVLAAFAAKKNYAPGPITLLSASSDGGLRSAALFRSTIRSD